MFRVLCVQAKGGFVEADLTVLPCLLHSEHKDFQPLNLDRLQFWIESGRIDATQTITMKHLLDSRCIHNIEDGVKLLGDVSYRKTYDLCSFWKQDHGC